MKRLTLTQRRFMWLLVLACMWAWMLVDVMYQPKIDELDAREERLSQQLQDARTRVDRLTFSMADCSHVPPATVLSRMETSHEPN